MDRHIIFCDIEPEAKCGSRQCVIHYHETQRTYRVVFATVEWILRVRGGHVMIVSHAADTPAVSFMITFYVANGIASTWDGVRKSLEVHRDARGDLQFDTRSGGVVSLGGRCGRCRNNQMGRAVRE